MRWLFLVHRYLGIAVGVLMAMWCLSGLVMLYVSYPALPNAVRVAHLQPIDWPHCCRLPAGALAGLAEVQAARLEMLAGEPVLSLRSLDDTRTIDLRTGTPLEGISCARARSVAATYTHRGSAPRLLGLIDYDQWTVEGGFDPERPLYRFALDDPRGTQLYVSSVSGRAVQISTERERFWNWLGAIPHWLYFARLRHQPALWQQVIIITSLIGCFLTATGLYIGITQYLRRRPSGRWSPYRGANLWHHLGGLMFGLLALSWVLSGLLSVNPWGLLEGDSAQAERASLQGDAPSLAQLAAAFTAQAATATGAVSITTAPLHGQLYLIATFADGARRRIDVLGHAAPLAPHDLAFIARTLNATGSTGPVASGRAAPPLQLIAHGDAYYYGEQDDAVLLPAYRLILPDHSGTRYYVDPISGALLAKIDRGAQDYRWWHDALHRLDFTAIIRGRPQWDLLMWLLLSGVTVVCLTGTYLGYRRLTG